MSNLTTNAAASALAGLKSLKGNLQNVQTSIVTPGGDALLRLVQGSWVFGQENIEVEADAEWAVNPLSVMHGYVAWTDYKKKKNEILAEVMVPASSPLPGYSELREVKDDEGNVLEYVQQIQFQLQCMTGEDKGEQVRYKATSVGGMNASKELLGEIVKQLDIDDSLPVPVLVLGTDSYQHKVWGKTFTPVFEIVDWVPLDEAIKAPMAQTEAPDADVKPDAAPQAEATRQRTRQADPAPAADNGADITPEDRKAAIDATMAEVARDRTARRQAAPAAEAPAEDGPGRRRRRN